MLKVTIAILFAFISCQVILAPLAHSKIDRRDFENALANFINLYEDPYTYNLENAASLLRETSETFLIEDFGLLYDSEQNPNDYENIKNKLDQLLQVIHRGWKRIVAEYVPNIPDRYNYPELVEIWDHLNIVFNSLIELRDMYEQVTPSYGHNAFFPGYQVTQFEASFNLKRLPGRVAVLITDSIDINSQRVKRIMQIPSLFAHAALLYEDKDQNIWVVEATMKRGTIKTLFQDFIQTYKGTRLAIFTFSEETIQDELEKNIDAYVEDALGRPYAMFGLSRYGKRACINVVNDLYEETTGRKLVQIPYSTVEGRGIMDMFLVLNMLVDNEYQEGESILRVMPSGVMLAPELDLALMTRKANTIDFMKYGNAISDYIFENVAGIRNGQTFKVKRRLKYKLSAFITLMFAKIFMGLNNSDLTPRGLSLYFDLNYTFKKLKAKMEIANNNFKNRWGYSMTALQLRQWLDHLDIYSLDLFIPYQYN